MSEDTVENWANLTEVEGVAITAVNRAKSNLWTEDHQIYHIRAVELVLADGAIRYGCVYPGCGFTSPSAFGIAGGHYPKKHPVVVEGPWSIYGEWTLNEIMGRLVDTENDMREALRRQATAEKKASELREENAALGKELRSAKSDIALMNRAARRLLGPVDPS